MERERQTDGGETERAGRDSKRAEASRRKIPRSIVCLRTLWGVYRTVGRGSFMVRLPGDSLRVLHAVWSRGEGWSTWGLLPGLALSSLYSIFTTSSALTDAHDVAKWQSSKTRSRNCRILRNSQNFGKGRQRSMYYGDKYCRYRFNQLGRKREPSAIQQRRSEEETTPEKPERCSGSFRAAGACPTSRARCRRRLSPLLHHLYVYAALSRSMLHSCTAILGRIEQITYLEYSHGLPDNLHDRADGDAGER